MGQAPQLSPDIVRDAAALARALVAASRTWTLYPPEHPAVGAGVGRLAEAIAQATAGGPFAMSATPDALLVEGLVVSGAGGDAVLGEAAALLHDRDILQIGFAGGVPVPAVHSLLTLLALDTEARRARGGPAVVWSASGHPSISIEQIDYQKVLEDREELPESRRRDDVWKAIARGIVDGRQEFDERAQRRLLQIAGDPIDIADLAREVMAPGHAADGSPMIMTQAATVLAAFRRLTSIVSVMAAGRTDELMRNLSEAASQLDPKVVMQILRTGEDGSETAGMVSGLAAGFDDLQVARLLAAALAAEGQASARLAEVFNTIAPDTERKQRVLTLTRSLLSESSFGRAGQLQVLWSSMEELLLSYDESPFVSEGYRAALDGAGARAQMLASRDLPPDLPDWLQTLGQENVRRLSVTLLIDLLTLEGNTAAGAEVARDMGALAEDLILGGDYAEAAEVARALASAAGESHAAGPRPEAARRTLDEAADSLAFRETVALLGDLDDAQMAAVRGLCDALGPETVNALRDAIAVERPTPASTRAGDLAVSFGALAVTRLAPLVEDRRPAVQAAAAALFGRIRSAQAVPLLQGLVRGGHPAVVRAAVGALAAIDDPSAARALHTVLRAASGEIRRAVIDALVSQPDAHVLPMLVRILDESDALGADHSVVLQTLGAVAALRADGAVRAVQRIMGQRRFFARSRTRALAETSVRTLAAIGSPAARHALETARTSGHRALRKAVRAVPSAGPGGAE